MFKRLFSTFRKLDLIKFNRKSEHDYDLFKGLLIDNMEFSALQFMIPNLENVDLSNKEGLREYFKDPDKEAHIKQAFKYMTNNHDVSPLGYCKIITDKNEFIGNTGWILHNIDKDGKASKIERGIHLKQDLCNTPSASFKPRVGALVIKKVVENLEKHQDSLNPDGHLISSILKSNTRSQAFTKKYKLNIGEPVENGNTVKWTQRIGDFTKRIPEIKDLLDKAIKEGGR